MYRLWVIMLRNKTIRASPEAYFDNVLDLYRFDKKLRVLIFNEVEKVEIAVREAIVNITTEISGDKFWITSPSSYKSSAFFKSTIEKIDTEYNWKILHKLTRLWSSKLTPVFC